MLYCSAEECQATDHLLLSTKLSRPAPPHHLVRRSHLHAPLQRVLACPLTLVAAPTGSGKTTLISSWIVDVSVPEAWVSLDPDDDDPARFWFHALTALARVHAPTGASVRLLLGHHVPPFELVLRGVINELSALPEHVVLVLDDYHVISAQPIHASMSFLLDHLPPHLHVVIITRADPPLPISRLRARGQLVEIRATDLRFTRDETASFLADVSGLRLSPDDIAVLDARTEGWAAGLHLAALSMQERQDVTSFLAGFSGTHRFIADYLTDEVLALQPPEVQEFLLQTSILNRLCAPLCEAVSGAPGAQPMLERLDAANLFLLPQDDERAWYRYHHLFADMLRQRLQREQPESVSLLHRRACDWYARHDMIHEAVHHALAAADVELAAQMIQRAAEETVKRGEVATLRAWLASLPPEIVRANAALCLWHAWILVRDGQFGAAQEFLENVEESGSSRSSPPPTSVAAASRERVVGNGMAASAGWVAAIRAFMAFRQGDAAHTINLARQALAELPPDAAARGVAAWNLGIAYMWSGDLAAGAEALTEAGSISLASGNAYAAIMTAFELAQIQVRQGTLHRAAQTYQHALDIAVERGGAIALAGPIFVGRGELAREWNKLDLAERDLVEGIAQCRQSGNAVIAVLGYISLARVKVAQGETEPARLLLRTVDRLVQAADLPPANVPQLLAWHARLSLLCDEPDAAYRWAQDHVTPVGGALDPTHEIEHLTWAHVLIARDRPVEVSGLLDRLLHAAEYGGRMGSVLEILILQAVAQRALGHDVVALECLARALRLAEPEGYIRLFIDEGAPVAQLLTRMRTSGDWCGSLRYRDHLLALLGDVTRQGDPHPSAAVSSPAPPLTDPLSERELEILRLIIAGCSNREIADRLVIAVSTVKWYINAIYGKLQVDSRTRAIARARDLHIG